MRFIQEDDSKYPASVKQIEPGDSVIGGPNGPINICLKNLTDRTGFLKKEFGNSFNGLNENKADKTDLNAVKKTADNAYAKSDTNALEIGSTKESIKNAGIASQGTLISKEAGGFYKNVNDIDANGFYRMAADVDDSFPGQVSGDSLVHVQWGSSDGFDLGVSNKNQRVWVKTKKTGEHSKWLSQLNAGDISHITNGTAKDKVVSEFALNEVTKRLFTGEGDKNISTEFGTQYDINNINGGLSSAATLPNQHFKIIGKTNDGKLAVISRGIATDGTMIIVGTGNQSSPALPGSSENQSWDLYRTTNVHALYRAYVVKYPKNKDVLERKTMLAALGVNENNAKTFKDLYYYVLSGTELSITEEVNCLEDGKFTMSFVASPYSSKKQEIIINGNSEVLNLFASEPTVRTIAFDGKKGINTISLKNNELNKVCNLIGFNLTKIQDLHNNMLDVNDYACYTKQTDYVNSLGAADYAFMSGKNKTWAGSYHGGETFIDAPIFYVDDSKYDIKSNNLAITKKFHIIQNNHLRWSSGEGMKIHSLLTFGDSNVSMQCHAYDCDVSVIAGFMGMSTTSTEFKKTVSSKVFNAELNGHQYALGPCYFVTQMHDDSGRMVTSYFTKPPFLKSDVGGAYVAYTEGAYSKVYSGFIKAQYANPVKLPDNFSWVFSRQFH